MGVWDTATPAGTDPISQGDDKIRELKTAIQEALRGGTTDGLEALFPGSAPSTAPVFHYRGLKGTTGARPTAGQYGLYINETLNTIQRDNGSAWVDVATLIPSGTKALFYQASPPTGWTAIAVNDKFLRVVTSAGTGGTTGGSGLAPSSTITLAHTHTVAAHTHTGPSHTHTVSPDGWGDADTTIASRLDTGGGTPKQADTSMTTSAAGTGATGSASPATDSQLSSTAFQYADVCAGTKD